MVVGSPTKLNLIPSGVMPVVYINQGDAGYDKEFLVYNGDSPYNVPAGVSATIRGKKADGYGVTEAAALTEGSNLVTVTITEQMVAAAGANLYELVFVDTDGLRIATINMVWAVKADALGDAVISDSDLDYATTVMDQLQSVQAFKNQLDTNTDGLAAETAARIAADDTLQSNINTEAATRATQDAVLSARMDTFASLPPGSTSGNAELLDIRVAADGTTYPSAGDAVRGQVGDLKSDLSEKTKNLFNYHLLKATGITISNGAVSGTASAFNTAFNRGIPLGISFEANTQYTWSFKAKNTGDVTSGNGLSLRFKYTDNTVDANAIPNGTTTETQFSFTSASDKTIDSLLISYSAAGSNVWELTEIQLEKNTTATAYIPYVTAVDIIARMDIDEIETSVTALTNLVPSTLQSAITTQLSPNTHSVYGINAISDFPINRMYGMVNITENDISGFPEYGTYATFIKFNPLPTNAFSISLYVLANATEVKKIYVKFGFADGTGTNWKLLGASQQKSFSIIGDSYSTFVGWIVSGNASYYPTNSATVLKASDTWWYKLSKTLGWSLLINDSYSGSTICTDVRSTSQESEAFVNRIKNSIGESRVTETKPDVIFMFGGTNDSSLGRTVGTVQYSGWTDADLKKVIPAFCYMCDYLQAWNPNATIINIVNTGLNADIVLGMATACEHYGITNVVLDNIDKANGHPTATGMTSICNQVISAMSLII